MASVPLEVTGSTTPPPDVVAHDLGDVVPPPVDQPGNIMVAVVLFFF